MFLNTMMVQLDIDASAVPRLKFAWELAEQFEAELIAFAAANPHIVVSGDDSGLVASELMRRDLEEIEERLKVLEREFQALMKDDPRASWRGFVGDPTSLLALHSRAADLVVIGAPAPGTASDYHRTVDPGTLILSAGRPILLASETLEPVRHESVLVAWKDTREARRAVVDAMPFLIRAKNVLVVTIDEGGKKAARESAAEVVRFLIKHGTKARSEVIDVDRSQVSDALTKVASEVGADVLVAGGYGHSRLREWAFGGVTRSLLQERGPHRLISN